ncbi:MAG: translation initiation factor IF-2 [Planctomycetaceae bacterium]|nr:translation initiation factor IF-2 [Planctomycetaceae bacterium]
MKIRIFALARDLGLDSKVLIDLCEEAGVKLRNALATISEEERDQVVAYIKKKGTTGAVDSPAADLSPVRDQQAVVGKVRVIGPTATRPSQRSAHDEETEMSMQDPPAIDESPVAEPTIETEDTEIPVDAPPVVSDAEVPVTSSVVDVVETPVIPDPVAVPVAPAVVPAPAAPPTPVAAAPVSPAATPAAQEPSSDMMRRPRMQQVREMRPIASVKDREAAAATAASAKPAAPIKVNKEKTPPRPMVAAPPDYVPPVVKKPKPREEKAQKPVIGLSELVDRKSPLHEQLDALRKARQQQEGGEVAPTRSRGPVNKGSLLNELRASREAERQAKKLKRKKKSGTIELKTAAQISFPITVRALSEAIGRPAKSIIGLLLKQGRMVTINDALGEEESMEVAMELGVDLSFKRSRDIEAELLASLDHEDPPEMMQVRPPIITILGHVDHGKTTMVDKIRNANVAAGEFGGITQHIAAYQVNYEGHKLTFVDTPGHAAFGEMRSRGANVTDIVVLVVAADDGVMPQTVECISHAKNAGVPIVVALNKIDLPGVDEQRILQQLAQHEILPAEWGGEYEVVRTSGATGKGIDKLLETLILTAELHELKANPEREALGVCLESFRDEGRGALAWTIVQKGTLKVGDVVLCGTTYGRIRAMYNDRDELVTEAGPSVPVKISGLSDVPGAGDHFFVMKDIEEARETAESRMQEGRRESLSQRVAPMTLENILNQPRDGEGVQDLPLILKADSPGSIEALRSEIGKFEHPEVRVQIIHYGIGGVNESDVYLASAAGAIVVAFHVVAEDRAQILAEREGVEIRRYNIIYEVTDHIRLALQGLLRPERVEVSTGRAIVLRTFSISRFGTIAGCRVLNGTIARDSRIHLIRDQKVLNDYKIGSLKREKDDAKEVREGMECGIRLDGFNDVKEGDLLEAYRVDEIKRTLD